MGTVEGSNLIGGISDQLAAAVDRASASTVTVFARRRLPASGIAWTADGVVVTSNHGAERDDNIRIGMPDGTETTAKLAGRDPGSDIAVLRIEGSLAPIEWPGVDKPRVGHLALAIGRPSTGGAMASLGVVGALGGPWRTSTGTEMDGYIQTDATFFPGLPGAPRVGTAGRALGMNSSALGRGAGLTIPAASVARVVETLLRGGRIRRGYLGIGSQPARLPAAQAAKLDAQATALLVVGVEPGSPAERGGLLLGDILARMSGSSLLDTGDLQALLGPDSIGKETPVTVLRGGEPLELTITVGERE